MRKSGPFVKVKKKVAVAFSGGVDSSVVASILKEMGFDVIALHYRRGLRIIKEYFPSYKTKYDKEIEYIKLLADKINIPLKIYDFSDIYYRKVFVPLIEGYRMGYTPNPDVLCNKFIKFGELIKQASTLDIDYFAIGHYARTGRKNPYFFWEKEGELGLYGAVDFSKDQVYFLGQIPKGVLKRVTFPLGILYKSEVRRLAQYFNLPSRFKEESQGICFLGDLQFRDFLKKIFGTKKGDIIDIETKQKVGEHEGIYLYTIGQRKGLGIGGVSKPYFVADLDYKNNVVYVARGRDSNFLYFNKIIAEDINLFTPFDKFAYIFGAVRYRQKYIPVRVSVDNKRLSVETLKDKFWAPAIGQYINIVGAQSPNPFSPCTRLDDINDILNLIFGGGKTAGVKRDYAKLENSELGKRHNCRVYQEIASAKIVNRVNSIER